MAEILKFEKRSEELEKKLPPQLREFIDAVIVPALVNEYLAEENESNVLAPSNCAVANSAAMQSILREATQ